MLLVLGAVSGGILVAFQDWIASVARREVIRRPEIHGFAGMELIDERRISEVLDQVNTALRLFHTHSLGFGLFILVATLLVANMSVGERGRTVLCGLITAGAVLPFGWLALAGLIPFWGIDRVRPTIEWLIFVPFGALLLAGICGVPVYYLAKVLTRAMERHP